MMTAVKVLASLGIAALIVVFWAMLVASSPRTPSEREDSDDEQAEYLSGLRKHDKAAAR